MSDRKKRLQETLTQMTGKENAFDMLMWRLANASMDGESEDTVLDFLAYKIADGKVSTSELRPLLKEAIQELGPEYFRPEFTNLMRYEK
jgi:hypothetical protein